MIKSFIYISILIFNLVSCTNTVAYRAILPTFQFSYFDITPLSYSVQVGPGDSLFLLQYFANGERTMFIDGQTYLGILSQKQKTQLANLHVKTQHKSYHQYHNSNTDLDGKDLYFYFFNGNGSDSIKLSDRVGPMELHELWRWIEAERKTIDFTVTGKQLNWKVGPPPAPPAAANPGLPK